VKIAKNFSRKLKENEMKIFLDTANIEEIKKAVSTGIIDGVTTNPSLLSKEADDPLKHIIKIAEIVKGPVSAEVTSKDKEGMISEGKALAELSPYVVVKIPMTKYGISATYELAKEGIKVNVTLIFSPSQALLAMKAGAYFISPFIGRLDDISHDGMRLIREIVEIKRNYGFKSEILTASIRHPLHFLESAKAGVDIVTLPPKVFWQLFEHPLTDIGLEKFLADWNAKFSNGKIKK
jgi:transaldolase